MKKIVLLSGIIMATLISCSTDDSQTFDQNVKKPISNKEKEYASDFSLIARDSIIPENTTNTESEPIKPKKD
jgi:hypothetical protein